MSDTSYTATIKVEKVRRTQNTDSRSASHGSIKRDVVETINLTIKASTLLSLQAKVAAHVNLLDEEDL